jgi:hypothetical protein
MPSEGNKPKASIKNGLMMKKRQWLPKKNKKNSDKSKYPTTRNGGFLFL